MIRAAQLKDMEQILRVYDTARRYMKDSGNPTQWGDDYPARTLLESDIRKGQLYVDEEGGAVHGVFAFILGKDPTYAVIEQGAWQNDAPYGTIHRVAGDGAVKGVFARCLAFCLCLSGEIRIDTHHDNHTMQHLIEKNGFARCGIIHVEDGSPRIAYQYVGDIRGKSMDNS